MRKILFLTACLLLSAAGALAAHWTVNPHAYRYDMTVYAMLQMNGTAVADYSDYEVAAFCNSADSPTVYECRGVAKVLTATDGTKLLYLRIYSNVTTGESITFRVYRPSTGEETVLEEMADFEAEAVIGTPGEPMLLKLSSEVKGDVNGDGQVNEVDAQLILDVSAGLRTLESLPRPSAINVPGGNSNAYEVNAQIVLDYSVASEKPW